MYNSVLKERFIEEFSESNTRRDSARQLFDLFEKHEKMWSADLCTRSAEELQPIMNSAIGLRSYSKYLRVTILKTYLKWCVGHNVAGAIDSSDKLVVSNDEKMRCGTVANPAHLQWYLNQLLRPESDQTVDNVLRCYYWLAYSGATEEEALNVKTRDVDFSSMSIRCGKDKSIPIYREAIPALRNCVTLMEFVRIRESNIRPSYLERLKGDLLLRGIRATSNAILFRVQMSNKSKAANESGKTDLRLSYYKVFLSGYFYRTYEQERAGLPVDFERVALGSLMTADSNKKSARSETKAYRSNVVRQFKEDYECWKKIYT